MNRVQMGLTQILASHSSRKVWIRLGSVSNLLCHCCLFVSWSPEHEADDPAVRKSLAHLRMLLLGWDWDVCGTWPLHPVASFHKGAGGKPWAEVEICATPLFPGGGLRVCFSALRICISDTTRLALRWSRASLEHHGG